MKTFEIFSESKKKGQNGRRKFRAILYKIFPDSCIDEVNEVGTEYNSNGITWIREYCEKALPSIKGMFLRVEFLDDERTELCGHGMTDTIDGVPIFENATTIGTFTNGYIKEITDDNGENIIACIGEGEIDSSCYHNFCEKLDADIENGIYPQGSVEIMRTEENKGIVYKYGYKDFGRIPTEFIHSGYALIGVTPSDNSAKLIELNENNEKEEETKHMTESEINALVKQIVSEYTNQESAISQCQADCESKISEANAAVENITNEKNELTGSVEQLKDALEKVQADYEELDKKYHELWEEREALEKALAEAQAKERIGEMNAAISQFSAEEVAYAQAEIDAFNENPMTSEINSIVDKIYAEIGKQKKADEASIASEQNSAAVEVEDIFSAVESGGAAEDDNIF